MLGISLIMIKMVVRTLVIKFFFLICGFRVKNMNLLLEKRGYFTKIWFIWFLPACTAQSANASNIIWFTRPVELYIHGVSVSSVVQWYL